MRNFLIFCAAILGFSGSAHADNNAYKQTIPDGAVVGKGHLAVALWDVYDATLYAPGGKYDANKPVALTLHYFREIEGKDIAERSIKEIRKEGFSDDAKLSEWEKELAAIIPNVKEGSEITGAYKPGGPTQFYLGDKAIGSVKDPEFGPQFFGIWLSEKTSEPALRKQLLAGKE